MKSNKSVRLFLHLFTGGVFALAAILADYLMGSPPDWGPSQIFLLAVGLVIIFLGLVPNSGFVSRYSTNICLSLLSLFTLFVLGEMVFRAIGFDFSGEEQARNKIAICWRKPIVPTGEGFFRRAGPESWTGQVLNTRLNQRNILPNPYVNEPVITVKYNNKGFRNPDNISDWEIAVAGDSFTELGYLRYDELFTTILGKMLNVRVLNLGVSFATSFSELGYIRDYGISESTKHAVIVLFEGNDLRDLGSEYEALIRWRESGQREKREFKRQPSLMRAFVKKYYKFLSGSVGKPVEPINRVNAYFKSANGDIPITLKYTPMNGAELPEETVHQLNHFFKEYARFGKERQITVWLAFMPSKRRVLDGHVYFVDGADEKLKNWQPSDLPEYISGLCEQYGVRFIDLTPALVEETRKKKHLVYNSVHDTHLNSRGSLIVAKGIADHLSMQWALSQNTYYLSSDVH